MQRDNSLRAKTRDTEALFRHWIILKMIPRKGRISATAIHSKLEREFAILTTKRTVQRDLNSLSRLFPLESDQRNPQGWAWKSDADLFEIPGMDSRVALALHFVQRFLKPLFPPIVLDALEPFFQQAAKTLDAQPSEQMRGWLDKIRVLSFAQQRLAPEMSSEVVADIYEALFRGVRCTASYLPKEEGNEPREHEISPLALLIVDNIPHLLATNEDGHSLELLPLHRITKAALLTKPAVPPEGFSLQRYIDSGAFWL